MTIKTYNTVTLAGVVRQLPRFQPFLLSLFFPATRLFTGRKIAFDDIADDHRIAPFVSPIEAGQVMSARGSTLKDFSPAYIKPKHLVDPDRVLDRVPGEMIGGSMAPGARRDAVITDNLRMEREAIMKRLEWMAAQALLTGKVTVAGEKYPTAEVDFGRDAALTKALTGAALWTDSASKPLDDIEDWSGEIAAPGTDIIMGQAAWRAFRQHADVKEALDTQIRGSASSLEIGAGNGAWYQLKGTLSGTMRVFVYSAYYEAEGTGTPTKYLPDDTVILASTALQGVRAFGAIRDGDAGYRSMEMFPKNWSTNDDPFAEYTMTQSAPLMIPARPNASMAAKVV